MTLKERLDNTPLWLIASGICGGFVVGVMVTLAALQILIPDWRSRNSQVDHTKPVEIVAQPTPSAASPGRKPTATGPLGLDLERYNEKIESLSFSERQHFFESVAGKSVDWTVSVQAVVPTSDGVMLLFYPLNGGSQATAWFGQKEKTRAMGLNMRDIISIAGTIRENSWRDIDGTSFEFVQHPTPTPPVKRSK
jgi:hypothetical protein